MNKIIFVYSMSLLLLSCSTVPTVTEQSIYSAFPEFDMSEQAADASLKQTDEENADQQSSSPDLSKPLSSQAPTKFNISIHQTNARDFFMGLVAETKQNMMVHPDVSGMISLELKNVTIDQIMEAVQKVYGYDYKKTDIGYIVYPATLQTKLFKINRLDLIRQGQSNTRVSSGQISENRNQSTSVNNNSHSTNSNSTQSSGSWIKTRSETDFWQEIQSALHAIIANDPQASVTINKQTGVIVVRAKPMQIREAEQFITLSQKRLNKQVILEAKIIEIVLDDNHQAGVNWQSVVRKAIDTAPVLTGIGALGNTFREVFTVGGTWGDFGAYVELLETQGKTNILSSPRISTLNNQKAIIKVGRDEYFITDVSSNVVTSGNSTISNPDITWTPFFSGIALDVTPQINENDEITLHIHPSITRVENQTKEFTINGEAGSLPMALNTVRESDSIIKAKNGQIVVIGGLMQESANNNKRGIAGLSEIPYIGNLFRVNKGETKKSELVILLKASIINNDGDWLPALESSKKQLLKLKQHQLWK